ncbi:hypothetical protein TTHERM_001523409, partial (macronuclear) [Tetrahymena thermophila SB210]
MNSIQIDQNSLSELSSNLSKLTILEYLTLNLESNNIKDEGAIGLSQAILQLLEQNNCQQYLRPIKFRKYCQILKFFTQLQLDK